MRMVYLRRGNARSQPTRSHHKRHMSPQVFQPAGQSSQSLDSVRWEDFWGRFRELLRLSRNFWDHSYLITFCWSLYLKILPRAWASTSHLATFKIEIQKLRQKSRLEPRWNVESDLLPNSGRDLGSAFSSWQPAHLTSSTRYSNVAHVQETNFF